MSLKDDQQQNIQLELDFSSALTGEARKAGREETESSGATNGTESRSSSCRHSWFFRPPLGRVHSSNSQTVRAISVTPSAQKSRAVWRINSSSPASNVRPQKVRDSGMQLTRARSAGVPSGSGHNVQDHAPWRAQQTQAAREGILT